VGTEVAGAVSAAFSSGSKLKPAARIQQSLASKQKERATRNQKPATAWRHQQQTVAAEAAAAEADAATAQKQ